MYGKNLKDLNTRFPVKKKNYSKYYLRDICTQKEFSYKKIEIEKNQNLCIEEKNFYIFINKGNFKINNKIYKESKFIYSKDILNLKAEEKTSFYIFFFRNVKKPTISSFKKHKKSKVYLKNYKIKKKYWGSIIDLINNKNGAIKIIYMNKNSQSSMEFHIKKKENYYLDYGCLNLGVRYSRGINGLIKLKKNNSFYMKPGTMHIRIAKENCKIVEMSNKDDDGDSIIVHDGKNYKFKVG